MSIALVSVGGFLAMVALFAKPSRFLGARIGYAFVSEYCWRFVNALASSVALCFGAALAIVSALDSRFAIFIALSFSVAMVLIVTFVGERVAERELLRVPLGSSDFLPVSSYRPSPLIAIGLLIPAATLFLASALYVAALYGDLPRVLAIHFNALGQPDAYAPKPQAISGMILANSLSLGLATIMSYLALRKPEVFHRPWLEPSRWRYIAILSIAIFSVSSIAVSIGLMDVAYFNAFGEHVPGFGFAILALSTSAVALIATALALEFRGSRYR